jgi:hypothetical protein
MNIEVFRVQNEVPGRTGSASSACQDGSAETIEHGSGEYAADVRTSFVRLLWKYRSRPFHIPFRRALQMGTLNERQEMFPFRKVPLATSALVNVLFPR